MQWTPRSQRLGIRDLDGPFDGVPSHLVGPLVDWLYWVLYEQQASWDVGTMTWLCLRLRIPVSTGASGSGLFETLKSAARDADTFLDIIEGVLYAKQDFRVAHNLRTFLEAGGSTLTVGPSNSQLTEVVNPTAQKLVEEALSAGDEAAAELSHAWENAYGRSPDPSDAWDHAIKALECVLVPVVEPNNSKGTLGSVIAALNSAPQKWQAIFPGPNLDNDVANLVGALRLAWPNPDRHGGGTLRAPTLEEARAVIGVAATFLQMHRQGWIVKPR
ncbi:hypothetical protein [Allobranchiibius sp. GilTou73]|uniref:hypothetical protein n=1 Tax=Allobranchiibius sp. GilTou73 TaxID=2904523 RepID=UPI001F3D10F0|nr:hypothetical protein [Allobranchiibius sp. GilTou73]UIJ33374.1 hypothetical protein LVQ62_09235 [Allobranchiibius sp. GilTou73]